MKDGPDIARIAALIGNPARSNMLTALMSGKALTAAELAAEAGVTPQTASLHLGKLAESGLLTLRRQGRHKYFALASDEVGRVLEGLMGLAAGAGHLRVRTGPRDAALRHARVCYNHLAGEMGTRMYDALWARRYLDGVGLDGDEDDVVLTAEGAQFAASLGVDVDALARGRAPLCRPCLDWSERRTHLAGALGRAFLTRFETMGWVTRQPSSRLVMFTRQGLKGFDSHFPAVRSV